MFYFFQRPEKRQFNYKPRYYDPEKEAWERKKAAMGLDSQLTDEEKLRIRMRSKWGYSQESRSKTENKTKTLRIVVFFAILFFAIYVIFCTPVVEDFVTMFFKLGGK